MRLTAEKQGLVEPDQIMNSILAHGKGALDMPQFPREQVDGIVKTFNFYVRFPESRWPEIQLAEKETPEGELIFNQLREEFIDKYWTQDRGSFEDAASDPHSPLII